MRARILNASAGSGKTYQLAYKYVRDVVEQPTLYRHILAVTFTNKATEEMRSRILSEIHTLASGGKSGYLASLCAELSLDERTVRTRAREARTRILHDYSRFTILTIDTFFQRILRAFIQELGLDLNYNVEIETASVLSKSADALVEQIRIDEELQRWLTAFVQERIEDGKRWDVREGILALGNEIFKESNRETLSAERSKAELNRIVGKATGRAKAGKKEFQELGVRAMNLMNTAGVTTADFTGKSRSFAGYFAAAAAGEIKAPTATVRKMSATTEGWCAKDSPALPLVAELQPLLAELCARYDRSIRFWNTTDLLRENYRSFALLSDLYAKVQQMCDQENMMLLSETKYILSEFIGHNDAPFIYEKVGNRFEHFMIDEFQDTSVKEWENFLPLLQNAMAQSEATSVLIVGDIKQSIYRWRGGDWEILHRRAARELGEASTETIHLKENFRSLPLVVEFNNRMIGKVVESDNTALNQLLAQAPPHALGGKGPGRAARHPAGGLSRTRAERPQERAASRLRQYHPLRWRAAPHRTHQSSREQGVPPKRYDDSGAQRHGRHQSRLGTARLQAPEHGSPLPVRRDDAGGAHRRHGTDQFVRHRLPEAGHESCGFAEPGHLQPFLRQTLLRCGTHGRGGRLSQIAAAVPARRGVRTDRHAVRPSGATGGDRLPASRARTDHQLLRGPRSRHSPLPQWWDEQGSGRSLSVEQGETTIEITTIHKAKGLEKKVVLIPYCNWTLNPKSSGLSANIVWAEGTDGELEEIGRFPVRYKTSMGESLFSADYYREMIYAHVDNINLLYVALTRAVESLHIFIPQKGAKGPNVGQLILQNIAPEDGTVRLDGLEGSCSRDEAAETYEFGEFAGPEPDTHRKAKAAHVLLGDYPTSEPQLQLRLPTERYYEEEGRAELTPRDFGILMHRVFENAATTDEIYMAIEAMTQDGVLDEKEAPRLRELVEKALADPVTAEWFGGRWQVVRNENEIILPGSGTTRRPDRVMTDGERAVVVDYKFGDRETARHRKQIREYLRLLRQMGYTRTEGYLWYVRLGRTERVEEKED